MGCLLLLYLNPNHLSVYNLVSPFQKKLWVYWTLLEIYQFSKYWTSFSWSWNIIFFNTNGFNYLPKDYYQHISIEILSQNNIPANKHCLFTHSTVSRLKNKNLPEIYPMDLCAPWGSTVFHSKINPHNFSRYSFNGHVYPLGQE